MVSAGILAWPVLLPPHMPTGGGGGGSASVLAVVV